jgi:hypothetical protein
LCFTELVRRGELSAVAGKALAVYTLDEHGFYGKIIRCEAMKELATRTGSSAESENPPSRPRTGTVPEGGTADGAVEPPVASKVESPRQPENIMELKI